MNARWALAVAALQAGALAFIAGQREWIARTGEPLVLRTAPVDPNDPMRGAYVRLNYEIATVPPALCRGSTADWVKKSDYVRQQGLKDEVVYASVEVGEDLVARLVSLSDVPPVQGRFLRGRVLSADVSGVRVRYGVEALFMQADAARKMEAMVQHDRAGAPIDALLAVSPGGTAVLKGYEWEPLGLTLAFDRPVRPADSTPQFRQAPLTGVTVTLHNYGDRDLAVVDQPGGGSFRLVPTTRFGPPNHFTWPGPAATAPGADDVHVLKPGATYQVHLDLTQPRWWVLDTHKPGQAAMPLQEIRNDWSASFRIEYAPPGRAACRDLPRADLIRHVPLQSRAFTPNQGID